MSASREKKRRYNVRLEYIRRYEIWLREKPPMFLFWRWRKWLKSRPVLKDCERWADEWA